ncbi:hypothetical protein ACFE04_003822 [Oxalis oulophora]
MTRRCSHCSNNGHNSRTCPTRSGGGGGGVKLFGVRLTDGSIIKKSASMGNLSVAVQQHPDSPLSDHRDHGDGYLSDDLAHGSGSGNRQVERKKVVGREGRMILSLLGNRNAVSQQLSNSCYDIAARKQGDFMSLAMCGVAWTEDEHRLFLLGLQKLGKGDWRGIARNYVVSRTPTQVASHAQKYFIRQSNATRRKRRSSLFDMIHDDMATKTPTVPEEHVLPPSSLAIDSVNHSDTSKSIPSLNLSLNSEYEPMETTSEETMKKEEENISNGFQPIAPPGFFPTYIPVTYPFWPMNGTASSEEQKQTDHHQVLKPTPVFAKEAVNVDHLVGMSQLSIAEIERSHREPSPLSLKLIGEPSRQSAFHANPPVSQSDIGNGKCPIQAI